MLNLLLVIPILGIFSILFSHQLNKAENNYYDYSKKHSNLNHSTRWNRSYTKATNSIGNLFYSKYDNNNIKNFYNKNNISSFINKFKLIGLLRNMSYTTLDEKKPRNLEVSFYKINKKNFNFSKSFHATRSLIPPYKDTYSDFNLYNNKEYSDSTAIYYKKLALMFSVLNLIVSLIIYILFDFSNNQFQYIQEQFNLSVYDIYLGIDGVSIYFVLLTTIITPIGLLSNWNSIKNNVKYYLVIMLLLETLLLAVFLVLDILLFYIFFESILPPLFLLIGLFGSSNKVRASFYIFLYTLLGSLFLLLSILTICSIVGTTYFDILFKINFNYTTQIFLFCGIFIAFAVKTPTIFLNNWLLRAHVESPLGGSIILAAVVLKLSLYGIFRLILPILPKVTINFTYIIFAIGVITILYASFSTLRTIDIKELIAYSSVCHAAVYFLGLFTNTIQGIEGGILLGLGHGFVSSGLFICVGGILYDRSGTRLISYYRGVTQIMPLFSILFFILSLGNCGVPYTLNFIGEFMSLYGIFEKLPLLGLFASSSIILSAAYTIYLYNRVAFGGSFSQYFEENISDTNKREFLLLFTLIIFTIIFGIYPSFILDGIHYYVSSLLYYI